MATYYIKTDGASRGNPGLSGWGGVVEDENGNILLEVKGFLGIGTNNAAEYSAIGLTLTSLGRFLEESTDSLSETSVHVFSDSLLAVKQLNGEYKVSEKFQAIHKAITEQGRDVFKELKFSHIPRTENSLADRLANDAIDDYLRTIGSE